MRRMAMFDGKGRFTLKVAQPRLLQEITKLNEPCFPTSWKGDTAESLDSCNIGVRWCRCRGVSCIRQIRIREARAGYFGNIESDADQIGVVQTGTGQISVDKIGVGQI